MPRDGIAVPNLLSLQKKNGHHPGGDDTRVEETTLLYGK
jgi:hypothetical protein